MSKKRDCSVLMGSMIEVMELMGKEPRGTIIAIDQAGQVARQVVEYLEEDELRAISDSNKRKVCQFVHAGLWAPLDGCKNSFALSAKQIAKIFGLPLPEKESGEIGRREIKSAFSRRNWT